MKAPQPPDKPCAECPDAVVIEFLTHLQKYVRAVGYEAKSDPTFKAGVRWAVPSFADYDRFMSLMTKVDGLNLKETTP